MMKKKAITEYLHYYFQLCTTAYFLELYRLPRPVPALPLVNRKLSNFFYLPNHFTLRNDFLMSFLQLRLQFGDFLGLSLLSGNLAKESNDDNSQ